jgi:hypothetical protein
MIKETEMLAGLNITQRICIFNHYSLLHLYVQLYGLYVSVLK